jgi:urea carboxylase
VIERTIFSKVLVANRGAIACRIMRTLKRMGIRSVAVYSSADVGSLHVREADEAYCLGPGPASGSYLRGDLIVALAQQHGVQAIHPGYGFLSENAAFVRQCEKAGIVFIGPRASQIETFGLKHRARALAEQRAVPLLPGSGLLKDAKQARLEADLIGYPVMLKSTAGGGGIGMRLVQTADQLPEAYAAVARLAGGNFSDSGIYLEKYVADARHIEVQIFGDGNGRVISLGERDCSLQRRHQKVIEEAPASGLDVDQRNSIAASAVRLAQAIDYQSVGTVEYVFDTATKAFYFLEVNTRLQVEHGVTEAVYGIDLVEWMVRLAAGEEIREQLALPAAGAAIEVRLYAEDPAREFRPSTGTVTELNWPSAVRLESWIETGTSISAFYDPMLAKLIVHGRDRDEARARISSALKVTRISGLETNLQYLRQVIDSDEFARGGLTTAFLGDFEYQPATVEVLDGGLQTSLQDWPGRLGYWAVGVPPSGPMDALSHRLANRLVDNPSDAVTLECVMSGPRLRFAVGCTVAVTGARVSVLLDGQPQQMNQSFLVEAGSILSIGEVGEQGVRTYLAIGGGIDVPLYLGSRATFTLGQFGGHAGRCLRAGDVLHLIDEKHQSEPRTASVPIKDSRDGHWDIGVLYGPHGAPDFFLAEDVSNFFATDWVVHYNSSRTGIRLVGPKPQWARRDGGEAGLHPSNVHDNPYAIGSIDFTGDMPVVLGPDGPSLGGFVCPAVVAHAELWKVGQLRAGDTVRFHRLSLHNAVRLNRRLETWLEQLGGPLPASPQDDATCDITPVLVERRSTSDMPDVVYRQAGDRYILIEYGPLVLDLTLRLRVEALMLALQGLEQSGLLELTPGIRSLQVRYDPELLPRERLVEILLETEERIPSVEDLVVPSRIVYLPIAWDDSQTRLAIDRYAHSVRSDAPWCPSNLEFIRRINGLASIDELQALFFEASYLVLGLGDVYLGAPVATPIDPRHRLVTTKYNPARTWTPENAVGIGGAYLCVYGMEGPGGYQFLGRTLQMWNRWQYGPSGNPVFAKPWLLRSFDQLRFYPVTEEELLRIRIDFPLGRFALRIEETQFSQRQYQDFLQQQAESISRFKQIQQQAFEAERQRWVEADRDAAALSLDLVGQTANHTPVADVRPDGAMPVLAQVQGSVWKIMVVEGRAVRHGDVMLVLESMKMEFQVLAADDAEVVRVEVQEGSSVNVGDALLYLRHACENTP